MTILSKYNNYVVLKVRQFCCTKSTTILSYQSQSTTICSILLSVVKSTTILSYQSQSTSICCILLSVVKSTTILSYQSQSTSIRSILLSVVKSTTEIVPGMARYETSCYLRQKHLQCKFNCTLRNVIKKIMDARIVCLFLDAQVKRAPLAL